MFEFLKEKKTLNSKTQESVRQITTDDHLGNLNRDFFLFGGHPSPLALAFISPHVDFHSITRQLAEMAGDTKIVAMTTAGELCSQDGCGVYLEADGSWRTVVIQAFSPQLIDHAEIQTVPLHCEDIRSGNVALNHNDRVERIAGELEKIRPSFKLNAKDTFALTFIDGLSKSENYLMEAVYKTEKFPCLFVGGSAGGKLDFQDTWLFDGQKVLQNHAVTGFVKLAQGQRYGVLKSQNFQKTGSSFVVVEADPIQRTVTSVFDPVSSKVVPFIDALCAQFHTTPDRLQEALSDYAFGIEIEDECFVRSVANIDTQSGAVTFYCDLDVGDKLITLQQTDFLSQTRSDTQAYFRDKPKPAAILLNDCVLRRLSNLSALSNTTDLWPAPAAGFSTFGELYGININQTLSAVVLFSDVTEDYEDSFVDGFPVQYARFSNYFSRRNMMRTEREKMRVELHRAFGEVIKAAVDGDFSLRVTREFPDMELNKLVRRVNTLVETVQDGLEETGAVLSALANADLTKRVEGDFKGAFQILKTDTNEVAEKLAKIVQRLNVSSHTLKMTTGELVTSANDLNDRTNEQASANEETSVGVEQMAGTVRENAGKALSATDNTHQLVKTAESSGEAMAQASEAMRRIQASSASIVEIADMIDEIAFKTNLLALNASVEAARVGDQGRGFAVVAGEVRDLASSAAQASAEVKTLINHSVTEVEQGSSFVTKVEAQMEEMLTLVHESNGLMNDIARASTDQSDSIEEVNRAVGEMGRMTQQNASLVQQIHAAIAKTEAQAVEMDEIVSLFRLAETQAHDLGGIGKKAWQPKASYKREPVI